MVFISNLLFQATVQTKHMPSTHEFKQMQVKPSSLSFLNFTHVARISQQYFLIRLITNDPVKITLKDKLHKKKLTCQNVKKTFKEKTCLFVVACYYQTVKSLIEYHVNMCNLIG